ncbi:hypothetical protein EAG_10668 [Camponotus floridanus]|uniref:Uncharacterized protein n=1 Tax=Camponotus floridanus TaxID=104421 RepID=E2A5Z7_CAMFO|nr:hypothetical protein EAG_10668 [Camponotus floridanus]
MGASYLYLYPTDVRRAAAFDRCSPGMMHCGEEDRKLFCFLLLSEASLSTELTRLRTSPLPSSLRIACCLRCGNTAPMSPRFLTNLSLINRKITAFTTTPLELNCHRIKFSFP